jgi:hypothetical protein
MLDKLSAIDRYLDNHLKTDEQVQDFFRAYATFHERLLAEKIADEENAEKEEDVGESNTTKEDGVEEMDDEQYEAWLREVFDKAKKNRVLRRAIFEQFLNIPQRSKQLEAANIALSVTDASA